GVARTKAEAMVEIARARAHRPGALVAELVAVDHDRAHTEDPPVRAEQLRGEVGRLALAKRRKDVDGEVERAEELPSAAVAHRHAVLQRQEAVVALERQALCRPQAEEGR